MKKSNIITTILFILLIFACKSDSSKNMDYDLNGRWLLYEAYRNGSLTNTLEDGYFMFQDGFLETNIIGEVVEGEFALEGNQFRHQSAAPVLYTIREFSSDSLHLESKIQGFNFLFKLYKETEEDQDSI